MKREFWLAFVLVLVAGCGKPAADAAEGAKAPVSVEFAEVTARTMHETKEVPGSFVPALGQAARLAAPAPGRVASVFVKEGDAVSVGQVVAVIDNRVLAAQAKSAAAGADAARSQADSARLTAEAASEDQRLAVRSAEAALHLAESDSRSEIAQRDLDEKSARADLSKLQEGARPQEKAQAHQAVVQARVTQVRADQEYKRAQALAKEGFISKRDLADAKASLENANSSLESAKQAESLVLAGARPQELAAARYRLQSATEAHQSAIRSGEQKVALARNALEQARKSAKAAEAKHLDYLSNVAARRQKEADASAASADLSLREIRSPIAGHVSRRFLNPGDMADTTAPVVEVVGSGAVDFVGSVPAADAKAIERGMKVTIGKAEGVVVGVSAGDPASGLATVRVATSAKEAPGTYATAVVVTETHEKALAVPTSAVVQREGKAVVYVVEGDTAKQTEVEVGADEDGNTEITKGLKEGQKVVNLGQSELSDGAKVKEAEKPASEGKAANEKAADEKAPESKDPGAESKSDKPKGEGG